VIVSTFGLEDSRNAAASMLSAMMPNHWTASSACISACSLKGTTLHTIRDSPVVSLFLLQGRAALD